MAAGDVPALDARNHRRAHEAIRELSLSWNGTDGRGAWARYGGQPTWTPDPESGMRASGVTAALWAAVGAGQLRASEDGHRAYLVLDPEARRAARRDLLRLPAEQSHAVYRVGAAWAAASTSRKKRATVRPSSAASRRVKLA